MKSKVFFLLIGGLTCFLIACKKNINEDSNKANVLFVNASSMPGTISFLFKGEDLPVTPLEKDSISGTAGARYVPVVAGTHVITVNQSGGTDALASGNISLLKNRFYSFFVYDSVRNGKSGVLLLDDNLTPPLDTMAKVRILGLSPTADTFRILLFSPSDSIAYSFPQITFIGRQVSSSGLSGFATIRARKYIALQFVDSAHQYIIDTVLLSGSKTYTLYTRGNPPKSNTDPAPHLGIIKHY